MKITVQNYKFDFVPVKLVLKKNHLANLFAQKNNKTVAETLSSKKYSRLSAEVRKRYPLALNEKLGEFLYDLKMGGDDFYLRFLNQYGDDVYCDFSVAESLKTKGLYLFAVRDEIRYLGRTHEPFAKRINQGYGHLSPKNCYKDGQATNCRLNSLIAQYWKELACYVCPLEDDDEIDSLERTLIRQLQPEWNLALRQ